MSGSWIATFALQDAESEAAQNLHASLWAAGCTGIWEKAPVEAADVVRGAMDAAEHVLLDAYFADESWRVGTTAELDALARRHAARFLGAELMLERDWMEAHRRLAQPVLVGDFLIDPREPDDPGSLELGPAPDDAKWWLRVPARQAFGTGSHETTRLTLRALLDLDSRHAGQTVVDVGCGSGVLSFAARHLGASRVLGYDVDPVAAFAARVNAGLNQLELGRSLRFAAGNQEMLKPGLAHVLMVNVLPEKILGVEPSLSRLLRRGGTLLLSGLLAGEPIPESTASALERWRRLGWSPAQTYVEGEWIAFRMEHAGDRELRDGSEQSS